MSMPEALPIACSLTPGESHDRLSWIAALNKSSLLQHAREDLTLKLVYAAEARSRVREMVRREQTCCAFLRFDLRESTHRISLSITAPEQAREAADRPGARWDRPPRPRGGSRNDRRDARSWEGRRGRDDS